MSRRDLFGDLRSFFSLHTLKAPAGPPLAIASAKAPLSFAKAYAMIFGPSTAGSGIV